MTQPHSPTFSCREACDLVGITYRQLDYAVRQDCITPRQPARGSGSRRRFSRENILRLRAGKLVAEATGLGLTQALLDLPEEPSELLGVIEIKQTDRATLVVDLSYRDYEVPLDKLLLAAA
jgi:DNA-binding transcriptional MerR regulator